MPAVSARQIPARTVLAGGSAGTAAKDIADAIGMVGVVVVLAAGTSTTVQFPAAWDGAFVQLTFAENPGTAAKLWYSWNGTGLLTISVDAVPGADTDVAYHVMKVIP
jgi:hypothetical protein